ncbi:four-carbon acid sugar kinase family protein [Roseibium sp.]|uniref:four-carbon acid sugar kinase family protein n=1 Tax=Roseibium sp. TaxID=1936156 RepID=UPI003A986F51
MKILIIADDVTGALDSSVAFAGRGLSVLCALTPDHVTEALARSPDVLAISTNTREGSEQSAQNAVGAVWAACQKLAPWSQALLFKKVDSRLKGHVAAELSGLGAARSSWLVSPAIPRFARLVKSGTLFGAGIAEPISVAERTQCPLSAIVDVTEDADLDAAVLNHGAETLFVGAAGLAEALARRFAPARVKEFDCDLQGPALFAIGSRDPITLAQIETLKVAGIVPMPLPNGHADTAAALPAALQVLQLTQGPETLDGQTVAQQFADTCSQFIARFEPQTLVASGGETAAEIARQLGCGVLQVLGERLPGLPVSTMVDGRPGMTVITKSGGFGTPETLVKLAQNFIALPDAPI